MRISYLYPRVAAQCLDRGETMTGIDREHQRAPEATEMGNVVNRGILGPSMMKMKVVAMPLDPATPNQWRIRLELPLIMRNCHQHFYVKPELKHWPWLVTGLQSVEVVELSRIVILWTTLLKVMVVPNMMAEVIDLIGKCLGQDVGLFVDVEVQ